MGEKKAKTIYEMDQKTFNDTYINPKQGNLCRYKASDFIDKKVPKKNKEIFEVNWQNLEAVAPVFDQGKCSSSWAFAAINAIQAHEAILYGNKYKRQSVQELLDCIDPTDFRYSCGIGTPTQAYNYIQKAGGLSSEDVYPLKLGLENDKDEISTCKSKVENFSVTVGGGSGDIKPFDEAKLIDTILTMGPVTVMIDGRYLKNYRSGIFDGTEIEPENPDKPGKCEETQESLNTVLLIVGIGKDEATGQFYYIAQNSWGTNWGEQGYVRLLRKEGQNLCGMFICASYPKIQAF